MYLKSARTKDPNFSKYSKTLEIKKHRYAKVAIQILKKFSKINIHVYKK